MPGLGLFKLFDPEQEVLVKPFPEGCDFVPQSATDFLVPRWQINGADF